MEGEKAELVERSREEESERASWRVEEARLEEQLEALDEQKEAREEQKEVRERLEEELSQVTLQKEVLEEEKTSLSLALNKVGPLETP